MKVKEREYFQRRFRRRRLPSDLKVANGGEKGKTIQYFSESDD